MKKNIKEPLFLICLCAFNILACSDSDSSYLANSDRCAQLSEKEQQELAPTPLFKAVCANKKIEFKQELESSYEDFSKKNSEGDTALAMAIKLQRQDFVKDMIQKATIEDLKVPTKSSRSYVSLLAQYNMKEAFDILVEKFRLSAGFGTNVFGGFSDFDFEDDEEKISIHYVQTADFMSALKSIWFYGALTMEHPWNDFFYQEDIHGDIFLHAAAKYNKTEVISWFTQEHCVPEVSMDETEEEGSWLIADIAGWAWGTVKKGGDYAFRETGLRPFYVNRANDEGNTPLHIAAQNGNVKAIEQLLLCSQIDPSMRNNLGRAPISSLLSALDPDQNQVSESYKKAFDLLIDQTDPLWDFMPSNSFKNLINKADNESYTAIHYAARLKDPYFYNQLKAYGLPKPDNQGLSPSDRK